VLERAERHIASRTSRRGFLGKLGRSVVVLAGGGVIATALAPERASAHHICGHIASTGSCPHPFGKLARTDSFGFPVHPKYGYPVDDEGEIYTDPTTQERHKICEETVPSTYPFVKHPKYGGGWTRCCNGRLRHIQDCCSASRVRINGDGSVTGYCQTGLRVFCITYRELEASC
jgi:hypothetical protein